MIIERNNPIDSTGYCFISLYPNEQYRQRGLCHIITIEGWNWDQNDQPIPPRARILMLKLDEGDVAAVRQYAADLLIVTQEAAKLEQEKRELFEQARNR